MTQLLMIITDIFIINIMIITLMIIITLIMIMIVFCYKIVLLWAKLSLYNRANCLSVHFISCLYVTLFCSSVTLFICPSIYLFRSLDSLSSSRLLLLLLFILCHFIVLSFLYQSFSYPLSHYQSFTLN